MTLADEERRPAHEVVWGQSPLPFAYTGHAHEMTTPHTHDHVEINVVTHGRLSYLFGGERITIEPGEVALFWAAIPHQIIADTDVETRVCWVHLPLRDVLAWRLCDQDIGDILRGQPVRVAGDATHRDLARTIGKWEDEDGSPEFASIAALEAQAVVRRLFAFRRRHGERTGGDPARSPADRDLERVAAIARFAVERFRDQISAGDAARAASITTPYAMTMFRRVVGMTIGDYIVQCRIAEARRLLSTTGTPVAEVAHLSGFGSQSSFYAHFSKHCGATPKEYRAGFGAD